MAEERNLLEVQMYEPRFKIGETVFLPSRQGASATEITGYVSLVRQFPERGLISGVRLYQVNPFGIERIGSENELSDELTGRNFYTDKAQAETASRFLEVRLDEESWRIAVGDRDVQDENSPYSLGNCNLSPCCAEISEARDILLLCKKEGGLIVHDRDEMARYLFGSHDFKYDRQSPIGKLIEQLQVK